MGADVPRVRQSDRRRDLGNAAAIRHDWRTDDLPAEREAVHCRARRLEKRAGRIRGAGAAMNSQTCEASTCRTRFTHRWCTDCRARDLWRLADSRAGRDARGRVALVWRRLDLQTLFAARPDHPRQREEPSRGLAAPGPRPGVEGAISETPDEQLPPRDAHDDRRRPLRAGRDRSRSRPSTPPAAS